MAGLKLADWNLTPEQMTQRAKTATEPAVGQGVLRNSLGSMPCSKAHAVKPFPNLQIRAVGNCQGNAAVR